MGGRLDWTILQGHFLEANRKTTFQLAFLVGVSSAAEKRSPFSGDWLKTCQWRHIP
jgi:hypothetical protein